MFTVGIDVGGSTTKIVGYNENDGMFSPIQVKANDAVASIYGAFGKFISECKLSIDDISKVIITGVGSAYINDSIYNLPTFRVNEFTAIGLGGLRISGLESAVIVSMGTGTAFVKATGTEIVRIGGSGVGGGTILGLAALMLKKHDIDAVIALASKPLSVLHAAPISTVPVGSCVHAGPYNDCPQNACNMIP